MQAGGRIWGHTSASGERSSNPMATRGNMKQAPSSSGGHYEDREARLAPAHAKNWSRPSLVSHLFGSLCTHPRAYFQLHSWTEEVSRTWTCVAHRTRTANQTPLPCKAYRSPDCMSAAMILRGATPRRPLQLPSYGQLAVMDVSLVPLQPLIVRLRECDCD